MILVQMRVYLTSQGEYFMNYGNAKIQPDFAKMTFQPVFGVHEARYENFEQKVDDSGSNEGLTDFIR